MYGLITFLQESDKKYVPKIKKSLRKINFKIGKNATFIAHNILRIDFNEDINQAYIFAEELVT
jgi:hypothetical protein